VICSFLSQIASWTYELSNDDVIRARLRTLGVQEYKFKIEEGMEFVGLLFP
jgi:guanine nucleotide-binding protein subunit alpha